MPNKYSYCSHYYYVYITLPVHERKYALFFFKRQYSSQIFIDNFQKSKMVYY